MLGALKCRRGRGRGGCPSAGHLLPDRPLDPFSAGWTCGGCAARVRGREAEVVVKVAEERIR